MKKIIYYEAEDGERFKTEEECLAHENRFAELDKRIVFMSGKNEKMTGDFLHKADECYGIYIPSNEDAKALDKIFDDESIESPFHPCYKRETKAGHYYYKSGGWHCLEEEKARINEIELSFAKVRGLI